MKAICRTLAGLVLVLFVTSACASQSSDSLVFTIEQALVTSSGGADFSRLVPGEWDRVCVFRAGTPYARVDSVLGVAWRDVRDTSIAERQDAALLVFGDGSTVVEHVLYPVAKGDFGTPGPEQWYCLPRTNAVFQMRQPIDGSIPWIGPVSGGGQASRP